MTMPIPSMTGGAGGAAGPSTATGGYLSNPFATGEMAISYGGNATTAPVLSPWMLGGIAVAALLLWKRFK